MSVCVGALNNAAIKKLDLECWFPGYNAYRYVEAYAMLAYECMHDVDGYVEAFMRARVHVCLCLHACA